MFRVDLDPLEAAAIERRRKLEEDRKRRIFDPKQRQLGIDVQAIEEQMQNKQDQKYRDEVEAKAYALYTAKTENLLHQVHASVQSHRSQNKKELSDVNKTLAVIEQQRRANDHHLPINNQPIRTVEDTKQCGVSSCQVLEGEDNSSATRKRQQQEQMRLWCLLGARERHQKQQQQKNEAELEAEFWRKVDDRLLQMKEEEKKIRDNRTRDTSAFNYTEHVKKAAIVEPKLLENTTLDVPTLMDIKKDMPHIWKYYTEEQKQQIHKEEEAAKIEVATKRAAEDIAKQQWNHHENWLAQKSADLLKLKEQEKRETARRIAQENLQLAELERQRRLQARLNNTNPPTDAYFQQFNTSSR